MTPGTLRRLALLLGLTLSTATSSGCLSFCNPINPEAKAETHKLPLLPQQCRNHVYIFLVHGVDPLDAANLSGVRDYLNDLGYIKTYYGQLYDAPWYPGVIRRLHREDPEARFVLIGFSFGANAVRDVAQAVAADHIPIDLLVYLGGNTLSNVPEDRPANALRIVNLLATGFIWNGDTLDGAVNAQHSDSWHFGTPAHPHTLRVLTDELLQVAARVPIVTPAPPPLPPGPRPRPVLPPPTPEPPDDWDFLKL